MWAAFHGAWEVLALGAIVAVLTMHAKAVAATGLALMAYIPVLADAGATTRPASVALLVVHTVFGAPTHPAIGGLLVVGAEADAAACRAFGALLAVRALLVDTPLDWMRRRGVRRRCRSCWGCPIHGGSEL